MSLKDIDFDSIFDKAFDKVLSEHGLTEPSSLPRDPRASRTPEGATMPTYTYNPGAAAEAAMKDPTFIKNRDAAVMAGTSLELATARALVAYAARNGITQHLLTDAQYALVAKEQPNLDLDLIREPEWEDLGRNDGPMGRTAAQHNTDPERWAAENPKDAAALAEGERQQSLTDEQKDDEKSAKALIANTDIFMANATQAAKDAGFDTPPFSYKQQLSVSSKVNGVPVSEAVRNIAKAMYDQREAAAAAAKETHGPTVAEAREAVLNFEGDILVTDPNDKEF